MIFLDNLSLSLLKILDEEDLTYEKMAEQCDISSRYIGSIVRRTAIPSINYLERLCVGLSKSPNDLLLTSSVSEEEKQTAQPVTTVREVTHRDTKTYYPVCPTCGITLNREYQQYCDRCGQHLSWLNYHNKLLIVIR